MIDDVMFQNIIFLCVVFTVGWFVGKLFKKLPKILVIILGFIYFAKYLSIRTTPLLLVHFSFILGFSTGYSLLPTIKNYLEDFFYNLSGVFSWLKNVFSDFFRVFLPKKDTKERKEKTSSYERNLREKEEELKRQAEELKRKQAEAQEELRRAREEWEKVKNRGKNTKYPNTLQEAFDVLGTRPGLSLSEYKSIWRKEVMKYHPDKVNALGERLRKQAEEEMKMINRAWEIIERDY